MNAPTTPQTLPSSASDDSIPILRIAVERYARDAGAHRMIFWSDTRFTDAHRLYKRLGFTQTSAQRDLSDISNSVEYFFEKDL
jgi:putative acetyltransferase